MPNDNRLLLVDVGNTRIKWGLLSEASWLDFGAATYDEWRRMDSPTCLPLAGVRRAVVANVAGTGIAAELQALFDQRGIRVDWFQSSEQAGGLVNHYAVPEKLGCDRFAAAIGAWRLYRDDLIVVMAGTALTVDVVSREGRFEGGLIVPGLHLMHQALRQNTAQLDVVMGELAAVPTDTQSAIASGIVNAMCGAVERMQRAVCMRRGHWPRIIVSGGDGKLIASQLPSALHAEHLVLEGLACVAGDEMP